MPRNRRRETREQRNAFRNRFAQLDQWSSRLPSCSSSSCRHRNRSRWVLIAGGRPTVSMTRPCPIQSQPSKACRVRHRPVRRQHTHSTTRVPERLGKRTHKKNTWNSLRTRFLYALWMASRASLIVTPFRLRAVTSLPNGKCRSIFLTGGLVNGSFRIAGSSTVAELLLIFLYVHQCRLQDWTTLVNVLPRDFLPARFLSLNSDLQLDSFLLCGAGCR